MAKDTLEFFIYNHDERDFDYFDGDRSRLEDIMTAQNPEAISDELDNENIDGMLVLDEGNGRWYLGFASSMGIVAQRTGRRQADSIVRSGYTLPDGYWLQAKYPLEELSDPNIGDLWQSVQQRYVKDSSLKGMDLDFETGIPAQLADRAKTLEKQGLKDELTEAKFEKEEAKERKKAATKTSTKKVKKSTKKVKTKTKQKLKDTKKKTPKTKKKPAITGTQIGEIMKFLEIKKLAEYVHEGHTRLVAQGELTKGTEDPIRTNIIIDQKKVPPAQWNEIAIFLNKGDIVQIKTEDSSDGIYATNLEV